MDEVAALYEISLNRLSLLETNGEILKQVGYSITQQGELFGSSSLLSLIINRPIYTKVC